MKKPVFLNTGFLFLIIHIMVTSFAYDMSNFDYWIVSTDSL